MNLFVITNDDRGRLERLGKDQSTIFALKKLFLNEMCGAKETDIQSLAAERIAQGYIEKVFHQLGVIKPKNTGGKQPGNMV